MAGIGRLQAARNRARAGRKFRRKPRLQNGALKPYLLPKVGTHDGEIVFCETSYYLILKVIAGSGYRVAVTFLVRGPAFFDRLFQTIIEIFILPAFRNLGLIIEFNLVDQEAGKALGFAVNVLILGRHGGSRGFRGCIGRCLGHRFRVGTTDRQRLGERRSLSCRAGHRRRSRRCCRLGVAWSMRGERIVESWRRLHWRLRWERRGDALAVGVRLGLFAERADLEPRAGGKHEQFERARIEQTSRIGPGVGIDERGNFVFQNQRENAAISVSWLPKIPQEARVHVDNLCARYHAVADGVSYGGRFPIELEIFYPVAIGEAAGLPSGGMASLYDKKRDSGGIAGRGIEQGAQNLPLRGAQLDFGDGSRQICQTGRRSCIVGGRLGRRRLGGNLFHHLADDLGTKLGRVAVQNLANHSFHNWFNPTVLLHSCSQAKLIRKTLWGAKGGNPSNLLLYGRLQAFLGHFGTCPTGYLRQPTAKGESFWPGVSQNSAAKNAATKYN